jgi:hypothetical protein
MKYKYFKKSLSVFVAMAVFCGVLTSGWLTTEVEANAWNFTAIEVSPQGATPVSLSGNSRMSGGDVVRFHNIRVTNASGQNVSTSVNISIDGFHTPLAVSNGSDRTATLNRGGTAMVRIQNPSSAVVRVSFTLTHTSNLSTRPAAIIYDRSVGVSESVMMLDFLVANVGIQDMFGIRIHTEVPGHPNGWPERRDGTNELDGRQGASPLCPHPNDRGCSQTNFGSPPRNCGSYTSCRDNHHRNDTRLRDRLGKSPTTYTLRFVGHRLCYRTTTHHLDNGRGAARPPWATPRQLDTIVSTQYRDGNLMERIIQHELSHNLGADDFGGTDPLPPGYLRCLGGRCIMGPNLVFNEWCNNCAANIRRQKSAY